jgi:hypothetical protein
VAPQRNKAADAALQATLPGHYYLSGVTEVGAEILLRPNGKFEYSLAYGAVDEYAKGEWTVWNQRVIFRSQESRRKAASLQPSTDAVPLTLPQGQLLVDLRHGGESIAGLNVVAHIAVSHPEIDRGRWMVYAVPMADALRGSFQLDFDPPIAATKGFNATLAVEDDTLTLQREGRTMRFERQ